MKPIEKSTKLGNCQKPISLKINARKIAHLYAGRPDLVERVCDCLLHVVAGAEEEEAVGPPGGHAQDGLTGATPAGGNRFPAKKKREIISWPQLSHKTVHSPTVGKGRKTQQTMRRHLEYTAL